jgi:hypothetical protein
MKTSILLAISLAPAVALAQPSDTVDQPAPAASASAERAEIGVGVMVLTTQHLGGVGFAVEGAYHVSGAWWAHAELANGSFDDFWLAPKYVGSLTQVRAGVEARTCFADDFACVFAGADLGVQSTEIDTLTGGIYDDHLLMTESSLRPIVAPRIGGDVAIVRGLRLRPQGELVVDTNGYSGVAAGGELMYRW